MHYSVEFDLSSCVLKQMFESHKNMTVSAAILHQTLCITCH